LVEKLDLLTQSIGLRLRLREAAYRYVANHRRLDQHIGERLAFYRTLLPSPMPHVELPAEILGAAEIDGKYLRLRPGYPERAVLAASPNPETQAALALVVDRFPDYQAALLRQGRLLNDAKQPDAARTVLERACELQPTAAAAWCELARSHYLLRDWNAAYTCFKTALDRNPAYHPGWTYLLRFLRSTRHAEGPHLAARARELFPDDIGLVLLAIAVFTPAQQVAMLTDLLESPLRPDGDDIAAGARLSAAIAAAATADGGADALQLVHRACELFPHSARLADIANRLMQAHGQLDAAAAHAHRALALRRTAQAYAAEFPQQDGTFHRWQMVDHIQRHHSDGSENS
jgi:tetratricopeptide (TPR) repeat protein